MNNESFPTEPTPPEISPWHWGWAAALAAIVVVTAAFRYALPIRDGDIWFHLLYGKYFLEHRTLIADHTIFSWTPSSNDYIYCTWLSDIFLYLLHKVAGLTGLFAFRYACIAILIGACFLYARRLKVAAHPLTWFLCLLAVLMSYTAIFEKPEILSFVFMTLAAWNWWHIRSTGESAWRNCYLFPLIMLVWVNSHGGFVFGAVFFVLIWLGELLNTWLSPANVLSPRLRRHLTIALVLAVISVLFTPYGYHYPLQLFHELQPTQENLARNLSIASYASPFSFNDVFSLIVGADIAVVLLSILFIRNFKKIEWSSLLVNLVFAFLYTRFFRTTFYWVPVFLLSGLSLIASAPIISPAWRRGQKIVRMLPLLILLAGLGIAGLSLHNSFLRPERFLWMGFGISDGNPVAEAEYIKRYFPNARIGNTYNQGSYLLWNLWPKNRVFYDARHFPYRSWGNEFMAFTGGQKVKEMLRLYPCDLWCVSLHNISLLMSLLDSKEWHLAYYGRNSAILVRKDIPLPQYAPKTSDNIYDIQNLSSAIDCLKFACLIKDWHIAARILDTMNARFTYHTQQKGMLWANQLYHGMESFYNGRYRETVKHFAPMRYPPTIIRYLLTSSYHYLCGEAWQRGDDPSAKEYADKAWTLTPDDNPYSLYNMGAIGWQQKRDGSTISKKQPDWRWFLEEFLRTAPHDPEFDAFRPKAQAMLGDRQNDRPLLLVPPEPAHASRIFPVNQRISENSSAHPSPKNDRY